MTDLYDYQRNYTLDVLSSENTPLERDSSLVDDEFENDNYRFELEETDNLYISLSNLNSEDNANLELYVDSNNNGELDENDDLLDDSIEIGDDEIYYPEAAADTYFAVVYYEDGGEDETIDYQLNFDFGVNLFDEQTNYTLGVLTSENTPLQREASLVEDTHENDSYQFELEETENLYISLHNLDLEDDADLELYQDSNDNGELDDNDELLDSAAEIGDDGIYYSQAAADTYFAVVYYYDGGEDEAIDYKLNFNLDLNFNPLQDLTNIRDFDGNDLGAPDSWENIGFVDVQGDGDIEYLYVNPELGRWATIGPDDTGNVDFSNHSWGGDTRVVGIYIDPLIEAGVVEAGGPFDSQKRFQNDLYIDNLTLLHGDDYDGDGLQEVYFKVNDGTAVLHAYMHADGNIRYANYQSESDLQQFMNNNEVDSAIWSDWL
jgi:hypothetical protein